MPDCNVCGRTDADFKRQGRRPAVRCPCGSLERHRLMVELLRQNGLLDGRYRVLHLSGAERTMRVWMKRNNDRLTFVRNCNLLAIPEPDASLDFVIHNHVMEHIKQHRRAYSEQFRVLRPGGKLVFTIPVRRQDDEWLDDTVEFDHPLSIADRRKYYGQHDHVRSYGRQGALDALTAAGFEPRFVQVSDLDDCPVKADPERFRVQPFLAGFVAFKPE